MKTRPQRFVGTWQRQRFLAAYCCAYLLTVVFVPSITQAGQMMVSALEPTIWPGATVNGVVVPYRYRGGPDHQLSEAAIRISQLTYSNFLFSILKYGSVGATQLTAQSLDSETMIREVNSEVVLEKLLGRRPGAEDELPTGKAIVIISGILFEEGDDIFVQSEVRFLRRDISDEIRLEVQVGGETVELVGQLPSQGFAFAPRALSNLDIQKIEDAFLNNVRLHREPRADSRSRKIDLNPETPISYRVTDTKDGWMYIELYNSGQSGWIKAKPRLGSDTLASRLPELNLAEALAGYLRYRMALDGTAATENPVKIVGQVNRALNRYERHAGEKKSPEAAAMAKVIRGNLKILSANKRNLAERVAEARSYYAEAARVTSTSSAALNLDAVVRTYHGHMTGWADENPEAIEQTLRRALALDSRNLDIVANLQTIYRLVDSQDDVAAAVATEKLTKNQVLAEKAQQSLEKAIRFTWEPNDKAELYRVEIAYSHSFNQVPIVTTTEPEILIPVRYGSQFRVRVAAVDANGVQGPWSAFSRPETAELVPGQPGSVKFPTPD